MVKQKLHPEAIIPEKFPRNTKKRYLKHIRDFLGVNLYNNAREKVIVDTINSLAEIRNEAADIINAVLDGLIKSHF